MTTQPLFTRSGQQHTGPVVTDDKGRPAYSYRVTCFRCGGAGGADKWAHTGWTCFECGGSGHRGTTTALLYTAEQIAKLDATKAKRDAIRFAKQQAAAAEQQRLANAQRDEWIAANRDLYDGIVELASRTEFLASMCDAVQSRGMLTENQVAAARKVIDKIRAEDKRREEATYIGAIGERLVLTLTVDKIVDITFRDAGGYARFGSRYLFICRDEHGNAITYKGNSHAMPGEGETATVKATIAEHTEYNGLKQTVISRPSEVAAKAAA